jgi:hypothetical protein
MQQISLKMTDDLFQALSLKAQEKKLSISDTIREFIVMGLDQSGTEEQLLLVPQKPEKETPLQKRIATQTLFTYCLLEELIKNTVPKGDDICNKAESRAEKLTIAMIQKLCKTEIQSGS